MLSKWGMFTLTVFCNAFYTVTLALATLSSGEFPSLYGGYTANTGEEAAAAINLPFLQLKQEMPRAPNTEQIYIAAKNTVE